MPSNQHPPCALIAGESPITAAGRAAALVIAVSLLLGLHLLGDDNERVVLILLVCAGVPAASSVKKPLIVLDLRFRLGVEAVGNI
ncbi:hypothetical protein [Amycolatopsis sp. NPDC098790]|uniref:hypothetical protein n=1 Tax=Amycolatopsis sp. NPDC098790 TaxID=3363939 RepID=UPI0038174BC1